MKTLFASLLLVWALAAQAQQSAWTRARYAQYTHETYQNYAPFTQRIDYTKVDYALLDAAIFYETNRQRVANGKPIFQPSAALEQAAFEHSRDMVQRNFFSHTSVVAGKADMTDRLRAVGLPMSACSENIAIGFGLQYEPGKSVYGPAQNGGYFSYEHKGTPLYNHTYASAAKALLTQWMNSPGHKANILGSYAYMGGGAYFYADTGFYGMPKLKATQNFSSTPAPNDAASTWLPPLGLHSSVPVNTR